MMASMFSELIIAYLFLGGAGGGCCLVTAALTWLAQPAALGQVLAGRLRGAAARPWQRFFGALHLASLGALIVGAVCLMADLGRPDRLLLVLLHPVPTYVGFGAWAVILCIGLTAVNCSVWLGLLPATRRKLLVLSSLMAVAAAAVVLYTGLMLSDIPAIPLWNTPWLVALFVLSALSCGVALALCAAFVSGSVPVFLSTLMRLARVDAAFIAIEVLVGVFCLAAVWVDAGSAAEAANGTQIAARTSLCSLLVGSHAVLFWGGFAFVGLLLPFLQDVILVRSAPSAKGADALRRCSLSMMGVAFCVLFGGLMLRMLVVDAALQPLSVLAS